MTFFLINIFTFKPEEHRYNPLAQGALAFYLLPPFKPEQMFLTVPLYSSIVYSATFLFLKLVLAGGPDKGAADKQ